MKTEKELASIWFGNKSYLEQHALSDEYFESRNPSLLTIEQVLQIYSCEVGKAKILEKDLSEFGIQKSTRELALEWWGNLSISDKSVIGASTASLRNFNGVTWQNFTGREIEEIWRKETNQKQFIDKPQYKEIRKALDNKYNAKQFKEFNSELFKAYIDKFSDEDKYEALRLLAESFNLNFEFKNDFTTMWNHKLSK